MEKNTATSGQECLSLEGGQFLRLVEQQAENTGLSPNQLVALLGLINLLTILEVAAREQETSTVGISPGKSNSNGDLKGLLSSLLQQKGGGGTDKLGNLAGLLAKNPATLNGLLSLLNDYSAPENKGQSESKSGRPAVSTGRENIAGSNTTEGRHGR